MYSFILGTQQIDLIANLIDIAEMRIGKLENKAVENIYIKA